MRQVSVRSSLVGSRNRERLNRSCRNWCRFTHPPTGLPTTMNPTPVVLYGESARLEPLDTSHADQLLEAAQDDVIWQFMPVPRPATRADIVILIEKAWSAAATGAELPFAIIDAKTDRA